MSNVIIKTDFNFQNQVNLYKGKVRDVYTIKDDLLVMIASDRISAFDHVLPEGIPYKGQVLSQIAASFSKTQATLFLIGWKLHQILLLLLVKGVSHLKWKWLSEVT